MNKIKTKTMKNILIILTLFLFSCNDNVTISKEEYNKLKGDTVKPEYPKHLIIGYLNKSRNEFLIELGSDGHEYAHNINSYFEAYVCFHWVDCKKCKRDTL